MNNSNRRIVYNVKDRHLAKRINYLRCLNIDNMRRHEWNKCRIMALKEISTTEGTLFTDKENAKRKIKMILTRESQMRDRMNMRDQEIKLLLQKLDGKYGRGKK